MSANEIKLWCAVVQRALDDISIDARKDFDYRGKRSELLIREAKYFLFSQDPYWSNHRKWVFEAAGINMQAFQGANHEILDQARKRARRGRNISV